MTADDDDNSHEILQKFVDDNPVWIKRWLTAQAEFDAGRPESLWALQRETQRDMEAETALLSKTKSGE